MNRWARTAAILAAQLLVAFAILEVVARILDPLGISYYPETARFYDQLIREEPISYRLPAGLAGDFHGVPVSINSLGLRDEDVEVKKPDGEIRVLLMGDSVPFGVGVTYQEAIPRQLEVNLNRGLDAGRRYRVINMGVPSYNTEQELIQLRTLGLGLNPDLVVLIFSMNDIETRGWVYEKRANPITDMAQRSYAASLLFVGFRMLRERVGVAPAQINYGEYREGAARWRAIRDSLAEMTELLAARSVPLVVFVREDFDQPHARLLAQLAREAGFVLLPLQPAKDPRYDPADPRGFVNSVVDSHCNPAGCSIFAAVMAEELRAVSCDTGGCTVIGGVR